MLLERQSDTTELSSRPVYDAKSKLSGWDAIKDIPSYLRADIKKEFDSYRSYYHIGDLMDIDLVLDYDELVSSSAYAGKVIPDRRIPAGVIRIYYRCGKTYGNLSNRRSPIYISPRYPRKQELTDMVDRMSEICDEWDAELLNDIEDEETSSFIANKFSKCRHSTTKELQPKLAKLIENSLKQLHSRLDAAAATYTKRFRNGRAFGFYLVESAS